MQKNEISCGEMAVTNQQSLVLNSELNAEPDYWRII